MGQGILQTSETLIDSRQVILMDLWSKEARRCKLEECRITREMLWPFIDSATKDDRVTHKKPWSLSDRVVPREA